MAETEQTLHVRNLRIPEVRVVALGELTPAEPAGKVLADVTSNLISVEVTRHASGPGEYKLTLNNWDPYAAKPQHKYNDLSVIRFAQRLRIDMRYLPDPHVNLRDKDANDAGWVPMIAGPITDMQFSFGGEGSRLSVTGEDDLRPLKDHSIKRVTFKAHELDIIEKTLHDCAQYPLTLAYPATPPTWLKFFFDTSKQNRINEALAKGQSYLEYVQKFLDQYDLELFLEFDPPDEQFLAKDKPNETRVRRQLLYLLPSRANDGPLDPLILLRNGHELFDFSPTIKVADQFTSARVRGRNRHRDEPKGVDGKAGVEYVQAEVDKYWEPGDPKLVPAPDIRKRFFPADNPSDDKEQTNLDEYRAEAAARTKLLRKSRELVVAQATTIGLPRLRPRRYVRVEGIDALFDGIYYVTATTHTWGSDGAKTRLTAQRAGMPLPEALKGTAP